MNNKVIFAAAGNGKTYNLCKEAINLAKTSKKYILLISYTHEGVISIEKEYKKQNFGVIDYNVKILTWYSFLLQEFIKPYQNLLELKSKIYKKEVNFVISENYIKSIAFYEEENKNSKFFRKDHIQYYMNNNKDLIKDKVSQFAFLYLDTLEKNVLDRLETIYSNIFFDEIQDCAGWDLEILKKLFTSKIVVTCVGDYKQATFRTNNSNKNSKYRDDKIKIFFEELGQKSQCQITYENNTRRFNKEICNFINTIHNDQDSLVTSEEDSIDNITENIGVYIIKSKYLELYCNYYAPTIIQYNKKTNIKFKHTCKIFNYGTSKGQTFDRTVIIPTATVLDFIFQGKKIEAPQTLSKFYVACTRARHSIVFVIDNIQNTSLFKLNQLNINGNYIPAYKYTTS